MFASLLGGKPAILTTSPRWVPLLKHDIHTLGMSSVCQDVVSSGMSVLDLERLPKEDIIRALGDMAKDHLMAELHADVIILGCAGMAGLEEEVRRKCGDGIEVLDPVRCGLELCASTVRMRLHTAKRGLYATP